MAQGTTVANSDPIVAGDESTTTRSLPENSVQGTNVGAPVTATDPDAGDTLSYGITGPNPGGFTIDATTGQLRSGPASSYDFEDPTKSSYTVTVTATDPHGASANIAVTVTVSDVDEPPGRPAVSISGQTLSSLSVEWDAPENAGRPAITDYDVEYRRASDVGWTPHPHAGTGVSAVIGDLDPGTDYLVRVMARNDEGDGEWSDTAQGTTVANESQDPGDDSTGCEIGAHPTGVRTVTGAWFEPDPSTMTVGVWTEYTLTVAGEGCVNVYFSRYSSQNPDRLLLRTWFNSVSDEMIEQGFQPSYPPDPESFCRSEEKASFETMTIGMGSRVWMIACDSGTTAVEMDDYKRSKQRRTRASADICHYGSRSTTRLRRSRFAVDLWPRGLLRGRPAVPRRHGPFTFRIVFSDDIDPYLLHFVYQRGRRHRLREPAPRHVGHRRLGNQERQAGGRAQRPVGDHGVAGLRWRRNRRP